ncbi:unnamed protein product [Camellia sinensis]
MYLVMEDLPAPVAMLEQRRQELLRKMDQLIQLEEKFKQGIYLNKEELKMIKQKDETSWLIDEYNEIFNDLKNFISQRQPQLVRSKESELTALTEMIYLGSLFDLSSDKEKIDLNKLKKIERKNFVAFENVDFDMIGKISKEMIQQLTDSWNTHSSHLQACKEIVADVLDPSSDSCTKLKSLLDRIVSSDHFNVPRNETFQKCSNKKWHGGTLNHWMEEYRVEMVVKSTVQAGSQRFEEARPTDIGRYIIRGVMKNVMHCHRNGIAHCNLKSDTIILDEKYDVTLTGNQYSHNQKDMRKDGADLKTILEILIGNEIPKDVAHLLKLLGNYQSYNQDIMFHHSCLWTPFEMIKNIFLFRMEIGCSPKVVVDHVWNALRNLPEENVDWASLVCMHPLYKRAFDKWQLEGVHSGGVLLSFMRMCFIHVHQHVKINQASQKEKKKEEVRPLRRTENDLFVLFPLYMPHFLEHTKFSALEFTEAISECIEAVHFKFESWIHMEKFFLPRQLDLVA